MLTDPRKTYNYFKKKFVLHKTAQNWYAFDNPFDPDGEGRRKMAVQFNYGHVKCWRTGWAGSIVTFVSQYEDISLYEAKKRLWSETVDGISAEQLATQVSYEQNPVELPLGYYPLLPVEGILGQRACNYLEGRGFDVEVLDAKGFGYCAQRDKDWKNDYYGYVIIPFTRRGRLVYYIGRDFMGRDRNPKFLTYKNPSKDVFGIGKADVLFNEDALELQPKVYVSEGWADALTMGDMGVATLGWSLSPAQHYKLFVSSVEEFVFVPDKGNLKKGWTFRQETARQILTLAEKFRIKLLNPDFFDGKDVNEVGREEVEYIEKHTAYVDLKQLMEMVA